MNDREPESMAEPRPKSAREKAAEARAAAEAAEKRRRLLINIAIGAVLAVVVAGIIIGALMSRSGNTPGPDPVAEAVQPTGAFPVGSAYQGGIPAGNGTATGKPVLEIWEDFQCPACAQFEVAFGPVINQMAAAGEAEVIWRSSSFLDAQFPGQHSQRAAAAWGCAIDAGKKTEYHDLVYANQPAVEGDGWTDEQLLGFAEQAGINGQARTTFEQCVADKKFFGWAANGTVWMQDAGVPGTPGLYLNGEELDRSVLASPEAFRKAVVDAGPPPSPSPSQ
jgi:protein-disulfide isomerase